MQECRQLSLFTEDSPANNPTQTQAYAERKKILVSSGRNLCGLLGSSGPLGSLERTLMASLGSGWTECCTIWRAVATPAGRSVFRLELSERPIEGTEFSWLPTPTATDSKGANTKAATDRSAFHGCRASVLRNYLHLLAGSPEGMTYPHPTFVERVMGFPAGYTDCGPWATP